MLSRFISTLWVSAKPIQGRKASFDTRNVKQAFIECHETTIQGKVLTGYVSRHVGRRRLVEEELLDVKGYGPSSYSIGSGSLVGGGQGYKYLE